MLGPKISRLLKYVHNIIVIYRHCIGIFECQHASLQKFFQIILPSKQIGKKYFSTQTSCSKKLQLLWFSFLDHGFIPCTMFMISGASPRSFCAGVQTFKNTMGEGVTPSKTVVLLFLIDFHKLIIFPLLFSQILSDWLLWGDTTVPAPCTPCACSSTMFFLFTLSQYDLKLNKVAQLKTVADVI